MEVLLLCLGFLILLFKEYFLSFFKKKGENLATKGDIEELTDKVESVKKDYELIRKTEGRKFLLKYEACMEALNLIDQYYLSEQKEDIEEKLIKKGCEEKIYVLGHLELGQIARKCHNKLVVSCDNPGTIEEFRKCIGLEGKNSLDGIVDFRRAVKTELGFGLDIIDQDRKGSWIMFI